MIAIRTAARMMRLGRWHFVVAGLLLYAFGALVAVLAGAPWSASRAILGYLVLFPAHLSVSYSNDYFDAESDRFGTSGLFTGGSGVLVAHPELRSPALGVAVGLVALSFAAAGVFARVHGGGRALPALVLLGNLLGWAYSAPPVRLVSRGPGEPATATTVGVLVPGMGYWALRGRLDQGLASLVPALLACGFAFILAVEIPDMDADALGGKRTWVVGRGRAFGFGGVAVACALATTWLLLHALFLSGRYTASLWPVSGLSLLLLGVALYAAWRRPPERLRAERLVNAILVALLVFLVASDLYLVSAAF